MSRTTLLLAGLTLLAVSCSGAAERPAPTLPPPPEARHTASPFPTAPPSPTPTPTTPACLSLPGEVLAGELADPVLPRTIPYRIYLPPCYALDPERPYPVVVLLHGLQLTDSQWDDLGVNEMADKLFRAGALPPMILVMPWERKGLEFETAVVDHLVPYVRSTYAGPGDRANTSIGGISRGAGWALRIGLNHPDQFGAIGLHSPAVLVPDIYWLPEWIVNAGSAMPALWIDIAERDTSRAGATELAAKLDELGVPYAWSSAPGEHAATYWSSRIGDYLKWYGARWVRD